MFFFLPGWPSYSTNWQRYTLMMKWESNQPASSSFTENAQVYWAICLKPRKHQIQAFPSCSSTLCYTVTISSSNKPPVSQWLLKDVIRVESRRTQRKHSDTLSYITQASACIIFVLPVATVIYYIIIRSHRWRDFSSFLIHSEDYSPQSVTTSSIVLLGSRELRYLWRCE